MKFFQKILPILLTLTILLSFLLVGCTPDDEDNNPSQNLPAPDHQTASDTGQSGTRNSEATMPGTGSAESNAGTGSAQTPDGRQDEGPDEGTDEETEEDGLEIMSEYTVEVGDNLGVGGN